MLEAILVANLVCFRGLQHILCLQKVTAKSNHVLSLQAAVDDGSKWVWSVGDTTVVETVIMVFIKECITTNHGSKRLLA